MFLTCHAHANPTAGGTKALSCDMTPAGRGDNSMPLVLHLPSAPQVQGTVGHTRGWTPSQILNLCEGGVQGSPKEGQNPVAAEARVGAEV